MASEAKVRADAYLRTVQGEPCVVFDWSAIEARTHWRFYWNTVASIEGRAPALKGVAPVAVDKRTGVALLDPKHREGEPLNAVFPARPSGVDAGTEHGARAIAQGWLDATLEHWSSITECRDLTYGWLFSWESDEYLRTGNLLYAYIPNTPLIVIKSNGDLLWELGTRARR
jgi:hypothetical protein